jgi:hypothetical protein
MVEQSGICCRRRRQLPVLLRTNGVHALALPLMLLVLLLIAMAPAVDATHFRFGTITWTVNPRNPRSVTFTVHSAWKKTYQNWTWFGKDFSQFKDSGQKLVIADAESKLTGAGGGLGKLGKLLGIGPKNQGVHVKNLSFTIIEENAQIGSQFDDCDVGDTFICFDLCVCFFVLSMVYMDSQIESF